MAAVAESVRYLPRWIRCNLSIGELAGVRDQIEKLPYSIGGGRQNLYGLDAIPLSGGRRNRWWRLKVPPFRVFFLPAGDEIVVAEVVRRDDDTYDDLARLDRYLLVRSGTGLRVVVPDPHAGELKDAESERPRGQTATPAVRRERQNPLSPFTDDQLSTLGITGDEISLIRSLGPGIEIADELSAAGADPDATEMAAAAWHDPAAVLAIFDQGRVPTADDLLLLDEGEIAQRASSVDSSAGLAPLGDAELQAVLDGTVEDWMYYLHPTQLRIVESETTGPSRIRGGPGTGKTVVALHRARWLAQTGRAERILLTTFVSILPKVWSKLYEAFAPEVTDRITATTVDSLARAIVEKAGGVVTTVDWRERSALLAETLAMIPEAGEALSGGPETLGDEIEYVIAGRGLDADGYAAAARRGRGRSLSPSQRQKVYAAYEAYRDLLARRGRTDWSHMRLEAVGLAREGAGPRFDAIVVDEAQDLTEAHLELLLALDADPEHGAVLLVGDGQQAIYPGGFSLRSAGLDVRGRSHLLRTNWRNTQFIANAAEAVIGDIPIGDLEDGPVRAGGVDASLPRRLGTPPVLYHLPKGEDPFVLLGEVVSDLLERFAPQDIAILTPENRDADRVATTLRPLRTIDLRNYQGGAVTDIRTGTYFRAKGLEFKAVVVLNPTAHAQHRATSRFKDPADLVEGEAQWTRTLFVAMTRARDELVLIGAGRLADRLESARDEFDVEAW
jgi:hypothetical protein